MNLYFWDLWTRSQDSDRKKYERAVGGAWTKRMVMEIKKKAEHVTNLGNDQSLGFLFSFAVVCLEAGILF